VEEEITLLERLAQMRASGLLTEQEFEAEKRAILSPAPMPRTQTAPVPVTNWPQAESQPGGWTEEEATEPQAWRRIMPWIGGGLGAVLSLVGASFLGVGPPQIRWALMTEDQLKRELIASAAESGGLTFACFQSDGDCDAAVAASRETHALALRLCDSNPAGTACDIRDLSARSVTMIEGVGRMTDEFLQTTEQDMLDSL